MNFLLWLLSESFDIQIGKIIEIPGCDNRYTIHAQIIKIQGDTVWMRQISPGKPAPIEDDMAGGPPFKMTRKAVSHFINDLTGKVQVNGKSDDPYINKVLNGEATFLGKGDDGVVFDAGDMVVKVSTTVPYIPTAQHQRNPSTAARMLYNSTKITEMLRKQGVPGILPTYIKFVGDKAFVVKPKVEIKKTFNRKELKEVQTSMEAIHKAGYSIDDEIQVGLWNGKMYHFDLDKISKITHKDDAKSDMERLDTLMAKSDLSRPEKEWDYLVEMLTFWYTKDHEWHDKYIRKLIKQKVLMDREYPERKEETEREFRQIVDN